MKEYTYTYCARACIIYVCVHTHACARYFNFIWFFNF